MTSGSTLREPLAPGGTIGIVGGGQLGRMLALAAARLGLKANILSDEENAPAFQVATRSFRGDYKDTDRVGAFARSCDAITFEFENVPAETIEFLAAIAPTEPRAAALRITQDRLAEKEFVSSLGIAT
ncbi:MAG: 5-(carboxyamino)imidazole ribonucleotide synthase, partial [Alphaproteobacteria bacterium]|nr:5-(carboxyamino)imidazole ribonucleotide synthase [Alphaproteobacteria bacterium]